MLSQDDVARCRAVLESSSWIDGKATAGEVAALAKRNLQVPETSPEARELGDVILKALGRNPLFNSAALPLRADVSTTLFLTDPAE